jgi:Delta-aminolevulinic acid dehydratase
MTNRFPTMRLRRLRSSQVMRDLLQEHTVSVNDLIYPIFVEEELPHSRAQAGYRDQGDRHGRHQSGDDIRRQPSQGRHRQ